MSSGFISICREVRMCMDTCVRGVLTFVSKHGNPEIDVGCSSLSFSSIYIEVHFFPSTQLADSASLVHQLAPGIPDLCFRSARITSKLSCPPRFHIGAAD